MVDAEASAISAAAAAKLMRDLTMVFMISPEWLGVKCSIR
jgi:hypothetical protein